MRIILRALLLAALAAMLSFSASCSCGDDDDDSAADDDSGFDDDSSSDDDSAADDDTAESPATHEEFTIESGDLTLTVHFNPFGYRLTAPDKGIVTESYRYGEESHLFYYRDGKLFRLANFLAHEEDGEGGRTFYYMTTEGTRARVNIRFVSGKLPRIALSLDDTGGFLWPGQHVQLFEDEAIYGLIERINSLPGESESNPKEVGSINRRGQILDIVVQGTIGLYTTFYHSSRGYGLWVDTTFYGLYDVGALVNDRLRFVFNTAAGYDPALTYYIAYGPTHDEILDLYTEQTGRPYVPPKWAFKHWRWRDEHAPVAGDLDGHSINGEVAEDVLMYEDLAFPIGNYMIDRPYTPGAQGFAEFSWDPVRFPNASDMIDSLVSRGYHLIVWGAPWAIGDLPGQNGWEADQFGYHAPGSDDHIDFTNPDAYDWWKNKLYNWVTENGIHGWKLDRGDETQPSFWWNIYHDGRTGAEVRNDYPLLYQRCYFEAMQEAWGDDFVNKFRAGWNGSQQYGVVWAGDTRGHVSGQPTDLGLRSAMIEVLNAAFMGFPIWMSDTGGYQEFRDREVFARWLEFSAFTPFMEIGGQGAHAPWDMPTDPSYDTEMIEIYKTYTELHHELVDYLYDLAMTAGESGRAIARALVFDHPDDPAVREMWDEYMLGPDILVAPVWEIGRRERDVYIPDGQFADYWDPDTTITGPATVTADAPLDRIPLYIRKGADLFGRTW